ncbi:hypothetical protein [Pedobacter ginsenosidimutans]|uniref:hypothetical protein n=1 Tax=Pedobacter ginsenosidimutans TaxID=687842 RepID=UPI0009F82646|nr:hypothetical protein [Pedobacter ginsenosidimutans]
MITFNPPIKDRTTEQILQIVSSPEDWNDIALVQAEEEIKLRNIPEREINQSKFYAQKAIEIENFKLANESYSISDFIFSPPTTLFEIIVSWELRKDGYIRKAD